MTTQKSQESLEQRVQLVRDLLEKQQLVEHLANMQSSSHADIIGSLVHRQHLTELERKLKKIHTADISDMLEALPMSDRIQLWNTVKTERGGEILLEVSDVVRSSLIENSTAAELSNILSALDGEDLAYIADDIPESVLQQCLEALSLSDRKWLHSSFAYEEHEVGHWMSNEYVSVTDTAKICDIEQKLRRAKSLPSHNNKIFITDRRGILIGSLKLQDLLLNDPDTYAADIMDRDTHKFLATDDAEEVANAFERYDLVSAAVINERGKLIGRLTVDTVLDIIRDASNDEVYSMAGLRKGEDLFSPVMTSARNRILWLVINLFSAFVASRVIGVFEETMLQLIALAVLMPIVASVGGNTGNQTTALIIRGLAQGQVGDHNTWYLVRKEFRIGIINGVILGVLVGVFALLLYQNPLLSLVIALAMMLTMVIAALLGLAIPILLHKLGKDPALGSSVIQTATTDSVGFFIFLGLASWWLV